MQNKTNIRDMEMLMLLYRGWLDGENAVAAPPGYGAAARRLAKRGLCAHVGGNGLFAIHTAGKSAFDDLLAQLAEKEAN